MSRRGKIARLPHAIRQELNTQLQNGEQGKKLIVWLNSLPEVHTLVEAEFGGRPITAGNLTEWKTGGYLSWEADQHAREAALSVMEGASDLQIGPKNALTDRLTIFLASRMAVEVRKLDSLAPGPEKSKMWREICGGLLALGRIEHNGAKLRLERCKYADRLRQKRAEERLRKENEEPEMTYEEKEERIRAIMGTE